MKSKYEIVQAICAGCDSMAPWASVVTGGLAGGAFILGRSLLEKIQGEVDSINFDY